MDLQVQLRMEVLDRQQGDLDGVCILDSEAFQLSSFMSQNIVFHPSMRLEIFLFFCLKFEIGDIFLGIMIKLKGNT